ncbi:MAG TPA: hypothetical protein VMH27_13445 [Puia sp.]|nr:hypothetical protein [Puia sp.]
MPISPVFKRRLYSGLLAASCCLSLTTGCKKGGVAGNSQPIDTIPAVTPVGAPVGAPVTKTIGAAGGTIASADGRVELDFPAGALAANTDISIQPVAGEAPGGRGLGYHFQPDGSVFAKPVNLIFHYADTDVTGTLPGLLYIAYQDSAGRWKADIKTRVVDTAARTLSLGIHHFSIWEMGDRLHIVLDPNKTEVREKETRHLSVQIAGNDVISTSDPEIFLPVMTKLPDGAVKQWKLASDFGGGQDGTVTGSGNSATYAAPAVVLEETNEQVEADLNYSLTYFDNGQAVSVSKIILFQQITLIPDGYSYDVKIKDMQSGTAGMTINGLIDQYSDGASLQVDVNGNAVTISHIVNQAPTVTPTSGIGPDGQTHVTSQLDSLGTINITGGSGSVQTVGTSVQVVSVTLTSQGTTTPKWLFTSQGVSYTVGGDAVPGYPGAFSFVLADSAQSLAQGNITVTPKN